MDKKKVITLKDIASITGYSVYTVSRALNNEKDISVKTREKILSVADELGYIQNTTARNLRLGKTRNIGIIYDDFLNSYYSIVIKKMFIYLKEKGYDATLFYDFDSISKLNYKLMNRVISSNVDGVISLIEVTKDAFDLANRNNLPVVQYGSKSSIENINNVYFDDIDGGKLACNYLIKKGKRRIGFISSTKDHKGSMLRLEGYKLSLIENNLNIDDNLIIFLKEDKLDEYECLSKLLNYHVDSIIAFNDYTGYTLLRELNNMNINDIEIVGFDDISSIVPFANKIHSVSGNTTESSRIIADKLLKVIEENDEEILNVMLPMKLN